jgi:hypothetical protein
MNYGMVRFLKTEEEELFSTATLSWLLPTGPTSKPTGEIS